MDNIDLIEINPEKDEQQLVALFEKETGKTLFPAQSERLMLSVINHLSTLSKISFNEAFQNCFLKTAKGIFLDLIGEILGCPRLTASCGKDLLQVTLYEIFAVDKVLPKGTEIETKDGEYIFITDKDLVIPAGQTTATVGITSELAGAVLNNYKAGDINNLIKNFAYIESVSNVNGISGASDAEDDEHYRERLYLAPESFSTAGTTEGYEYYAKSAHKDIVDVKVKSSSAGTVDIYVLTKDGEASLAIQDAVSQVVTADKVRPLTDNVVVHSAIKVNYTISPTVKIKKEADYVKVSTLINELLEAYFISIKTKLKIAVIKSDIIALIKSIDGVYDVDFDDDISQLVADDTKFYNGSIGTLSVARVS
ncbi:MAG: baseplate J/gp47 family protein [Candidatus Gastranaerophilales bacterium]|nr:baseplate J/gp47 family protein [Candidatus Gastranaerophilales bacterium]